MDRQYCKPNFGPEETEQDQMAKLNASRNKVAATREELSRQIEERRQEREMQKQARLDVERMEMEINSIEMRHEQEKQKKIKAVAKQFVGEALTIG